MLSFASIGSASISHGPCFWAYRHTLRHVQAGSLILCNDKQLEQLICCDRMPGQLISAGKAHPHDAPGKQFLQRFFTLSCDNRYMGRIVFLESYDINVARGQVR